MTLDVVRKDLEDRLKQIGRQKRGIAQLRQHGLDTTAAEELLARMMAKVQEVRAERDQLKAAQARTYPGSTKVIRGAQRR